MAERVRLAFLGIDNPHGFSWRELLRQFSDEIEITALVPGFGGATASLEESLADLPRFETVDELIANGAFDAAVVCLPNDAGPAAVARLAEAGKHVLAEKPAAACADTFRPAAERLGEAEVAFQSGYMWRYDECADRLRQMVADGRFGKLISTEITFVTSDVRRRGPDHYLFDPNVSGAGFFNWLGCHQLDLIFYILQQPIVGVTARVGVFGGTDCQVEDGGTIVLDLADGSLVTFVGGYWLPRWAGESRWCIRGTERWVHWDPVRKGTAGVLEIHGPMPQWFAMEETFETTAEPCPGYGGHLGRAVIRDWLDAMARPGSVCRNTPGSTQATLELLDAVYRSSREERRVECDIRI